jgi:hypothetical protein
VLNEWTQKKMKKKKEEEEDDDKEEEEEEEADLIWLWRALPDSDCDLDLVNYSTHLGYYRRSQTYSRKWNVTLFIGYDMKKIDLSNPYEAK